MHSDSTLFFCSFQAVLRIRDILVRIQMRTRIRNLWYPHPDGSPGGLKIYGFKDPDPDSEHWYIYIFLQR
jgi:hypothetical protein